MKLVLLLLLLGACAPAVEQTEECVDLSTGCHPQWEIDAWYVAQEACVTDTECESAQEAQ